MQPLIAVGAELMRTAAAAVLEVDGARADDARLIAKLLVDADLAGHPSHGVYRVGEYHHGCTSGLVNPRGEPRVINETAPSTMSVDGGGTFGQVAAQFAAAVVCDRAASQGLSAVALRNCSHVGRLSDHVDAIAERGMIGIITANDAGANLIVAPPGALAGRLGTNPFAFAVPRAQRPHLIADFATSTVAYGAVVVNHRREDPTPSNDAKTRAVLEAFGGYKGFALSILVDVLSGILSGAGWSTSREVEESQGVFMMAIDPDRFCGRSSLVSAVEEMVAWIKSSPTTDGAPVLVPGEVGERARRENGDRIEIDQMTWNDLLCVFAETGVTPPPTVPA